MPEMEILELEAEDIVTLSTDDVSHGNNESGTVTAPDEEWGD